MIRRRRRERGQGLVELSIVIPTALLLLLGMLEFGFAFDHTLSLQYATREGARMGSALANGGGTLGCGTGQSPNAATVDPQIIAAVQRVITSPGSPLTLSQVSEIRIYKANSTGGEVSGSVNVWTYNAGGGPVVDGAALNFANTSTGWNACSRNNASSPDSIGVSLTYTYQFVTPLSGILGFFGGPGATSLPISDRTVMALNPS